MPKKPGRKKNPRPLTEQEQKYVEVKIMTGDKKAACIASGFDENSYPERRVAVQKALKDYKDEADSMFRVRATEMIDKLYELADSAKSETVKLGAIKDWLDRAGLAPVSKSEVEQRKIISTESRVSRELIERMNKMNELETEKGGDL